MQQLEISDLITVVDPDNGHRLPVRRAEVIRQLRASGDEHAARIVAGLPADQEDILDPHAVDRLLVSVHTELQRLSEELRMGERLVHVLGPLFTAIRATTGQPEPYRLVDVGCGLGYLVRWLAATNALGADVELVGVDLDATLVGEADRLARAEGLNCRFIHGDAFALPKAATVYVSTGVLHHFRGPALAKFFQVQAASPAHAFCHFDIAATSLAPIGSWIFHRARMRHPLGRHDGVVSARRGESVLHHVAPGHRSATAAGGAVSPGPRTGCAPTGRPGVPR
ncbi:class I SAM-dependent methyltransferase [Streptomyces sp. NBC_00316]|uniref:class I SAM-dependent methyltransferase n=1 Tax=Streptomyces sp. NBC_00316 TaxID=2975710 RepID=UPI002E2D5EAF|nr:class I SAM-dependent methyltransferase [Streptomyces sp. NBC_00316]